MSDKAKAIHAALTMLATAIDMPSFGEDPSLSYVLKSGRRIKVKLDGTVFSESRDKQQWREINGSKLEYFGRRADEFESADAFRAAYDNTPKHDRFSRMIEISTKDAQSHDVVFLTSPGWNFPFRRVSMPVSQLIALIYAAEFDSEAGGLCVTCLQLDERIEPDNDQAICQACQQPAVIGLSLLGHKLGGLL